jgi:hypothetical protein
MRRRMSGGAVAGSSAAHAGVKRCRSASHDLWLIDDRRGRLRCGMRRSDGGE